MKWLQRLIDRYVIHEATPREQLYRQEAVRIRGGDALSWVVLLTGFIPLALQNMAFAPIWLGLVVLWFVARRRGWALAHLGATRAAAAAAIAGFLYFGATRDTVWAFILFLVLIAMVLVLKSDLEVEVPRLYLVAFTLFLVFSHLTLEYSFLVVLFLMFLSGILLMLRYHFPEQVRRGKYLQTARVLAWPVFSAVLVTIPVFVVCPRVPVATLQLKQAPHTGGFSDKIQFGDMRGALDSDRVFMTIRTPKGHRWRGIVLDFYDGKGWRRTPRAGRRYDAGGDGTIWLEARQRAKGLSAFELADVILEPTDCRYYFAPQYPIAMESEFSAVMQDGARALIRTEEPQVKRIRYMLWFGKVNTADSALDTDDMGKYRKLLPRMSRSIGELARRVTEGATTDRQRAERVEKFLAEGEYTYSLDGAPPPGKDPVEWFLLEAKTGHCEYYSSSMALMLRTLGMATRVVNGFNPGKYDTYAGTWTVLERNCHSWCEVYLEGEGWVEFDPTTGNGREPISTLAQRLGLENVALYKMTVGLLNRMDFEWQRCVVSFSVSMQWGILQAIYKAYEDFEIWMRMQWNQARVPRPSMLAAALVVLGILLRLFRKPILRLWRRVIARLAPLLAWLRRELARWRARRREPQVGEFYHELVELLERHGIARARHETPWELARRLAALDAGLSIPVRRVADAYCSVAYRGKTLAEQDEAEIRRALDSVDACLRARGPVTPPRAS